MQDDMNKCLQEGIVLTGAWEPLMVLRRWGHSDAETLSNYEKSHQEEPMRLLAEHGYNFFVTHYHKGFGWETEKTERELVRKQVAHCRKHGVKIGVYFRVDNIIGETFFRERPEARTWVAREQNGNISVYGSFSPWRQKICFNEPAYREYAKKVVRYALEDIKADAVFFDGFSGRQDINACRCERCQKGFTRFLLDRWGKRRDEFVRLFGHDSIEGIEIPIWMEGASIAHLDRITAPELQEWIRYRCALFADFHNEMLAYIHALKPEALMCINSGVQSWLNMAAYLGVDLSLLAAGRECIFHEDGHFPEWREGNILCHRIREYKIGETLGKPVLAYGHYHGPDEGYFTRAMAESFAFNQGHGGHVGGHFGDVMNLFANKESSGRIRGIFSWRKEHTDLYAETEPASETALLRSFPSMTFDCRKTWRHQLLLEQLLIQRHIPFDIIFDKQLNRLEKYKLLILADQTCLDRETAGLIADFVRKGGSLLVTGQTGNFDGFARRHGENPLKAALGLGTGKTKVSAEAEDPSIAGFNPAALTASWPAQAWFYKDVLGGGRVAYIPEVIAAIEENLYPDWEYDGQKGRFVIKGELSGVSWREYPFCNWVLPKNQWELLDAVKWAGDFSFTVDGPEYLAVQHTRSKNGSREFVHFVNYRNDLLLKALSIFTAPGRYRKAVFHRLDPEPDDAQIDMSKTPGIIRIPEFKTYGVLELYKSESKKK